MTQLAFGFPPKQKWTPAALGGGVSLWLDASDAGTITIGTGVSIWHDKSPFKNHMFQATGGQQPTITTQRQNGLNVLTFDGVDDYFTTTPTITILDGDDMGFFAVMAPTAINNYHNIFDHAASVPMLWIEPGNTLQFNKDTAGGGVTTTASVDGTFQQYGCLNKSTNQEVFKNGVSTGYTASTPMIPGVRTPTFFNRAGGGTYTGKMGELLMITSLIDLNTRQKIEGYLAHKWGLKSQLPDTHPFKNSPP